MTDQFRLADALDKIAEGYAAAAMVLRIGAEASEPQEASGGVTAPSFEDLPFDDSEFHGNPDGSRVIEHGSAAVCPAHNIPYRKGRYGMYCPSTSDDPKWSNDKGYCQITPKSAPAWLRQHSGATA